MYPSNATTPKIPMRYKFFSLMYWNRVKLIPIDSKSKPPMHRVSSEDISCDAEFANI